MPLKTNAVDINRNTTGLTLTPEQSDEIIAKTIEQSAVMQLADRISLPGNGVTIPVITGDPTADFVAETAEKPVSNSTFAQKNMTPYKIAVIELFSNEFRRDYRRLYDELVRRLPYAISTKFDNTVFNGTAPGTGFDVLSGADPVTLVPSAYDGVLTAYDKIATAGYRPTGYALSPAAEVALYGTTSSDGQPLFLPSLQDGSIGSVLGVPVVKTRNVYFADDGVIGFVGDWSQAKWGMVEDIQIAISEEATINTGTELVNLWQRNMFAVRAEAEVGFIATGEDAFCKLTNVDNGNFE